MKVNVILAKCAGGHEERLIVNRSLEWVTTVAALLDGSSPFYVTPPGDDSIIGKCGICGEPITCSVEASAEEE